MVLGLAPDETNENLLQDDGDLEGAEDVVPPHRAEVEAGPLRVARDRLGARGEAVAPARHGRRLDPGLRVAGLAPKGQQVAQVHQRIAAGAHVPVEHGDRARRVLGADDHVVEFGVVVQQRDRLRRRTVRVEPGGDRIQARIVRFLGRVPTLGPAGQLALDEALGPAQLAKAGRFGIDLVEIGEGVDHGLADAPGEVRIALEARRQIGADDDAAAALHDMERRADHPVVRAQHVAARRQRIDPPEPGQHPVLPGHVVGAGRDRPERRPAQDVLGLPKAQQVGEIGVAAAELADLQRPLRPGQLVAQPGREPVGIEFLVGPDRNQLGIVAQR